MPLNLKKYHILQIGKRNHKFECEINVTKLESAECFKDLGITIMSSHIFSQQCKDTVGKANRMLVFINRDFFKNKDIMLPLTSFVRLHLEYAVQLSSEGMTTSLRNKPYEERLAKVNLFSLEKRRSEVKLLSV